MLSDTASQRARSTITGETVVADTTGFPGHVPGSTPTARCWSPRSGPAMLRVTGELADGTHHLAGGAADPRASTSCRSSSAAAEGRPAPQVIASLPVCVTNRPGRGHRTGRGPPGDVRPVRRLRGGAATRGRPQRAGDVAIIGDEAHVERADPRLRDAGATEFIGTHGVSPPRRNTTGPWRCSVLSGQATGSSLTSERATSSWLRELMPSLAKTLRRWYWTVRALMNSRAPISGFDRPSRASRAIWLSCGGQPFGAARTSVRLRAVSPVASSSRPARVGEGLHAHRLEHVVGECGAAPARRRGGAPGAATRRRAGARARDRACMRVRPSRSIASR